MIKSEVKSRHSNETPEYPMLVQHELSGCIILLRNETHGVVVSGTHTSSEVGGLVVFPMMTGSAASGYVEFQGSVTLRNR